MVRILRSSRAFYCPSPDALPPIDIWDVIDPVTYEPREGWIELTKQADTTNGVVLNPTIEAGVVNALQQECGQTAAEHGFSQDWEDAKWLEEYAGDFAAIDFDMVSVEEIEEIRHRLLRSATALRNNILGTKLMLIVSELSEGLESLRKHGGAAGALDGQGNLPEELADAIVRILDTGTFIKANLGDELIAKMAINQDRPMMHGNKAM